MMSELVVHLTFTLPVVVNAVGADALMEAFQAPQPRLIVAIWLSIALGLGIVTVFTVGVAVNKVQEFPGRWISSSIEPRTRIPDFCVFSHSLGPFLPMRRPGQKALAVAID